MKPERIIKQQEKMIDNRNSQIYYLKLENKQLKQIIRDLEKKNAYLKLLSERRS